ncbi:MAG: hypothetical protein KA004_02955 [Verrucomicrobiales bacterium]|nr:hypothetical protein [Verrucomicrobiales bacterium]
METSQRPADIRPHHYRFVRENTAAQGDTTLNLSSEKPTRFKALARLTLKKSRTWELKERFGGFWEVASPQPALPTGANEEA